MSHDMMKPKSPDGKRNVQGKVRDGASVPSLGANVALPENYPAVLSGIKSRIQTERIRVVLSANAAMVLLYWDIGNGILKQQKQQGWGAKVIDRLSFDLKEAFPELGGLSPRNLKYMRKFAESWADREMVQRTVAQIPWRSNLALLDKLDAPDQRLWYAQKTIENGWSRDVLAGNHREEHVEINIPDAVDPNSIQLELSCSPNMLDALAGALPFLAEYPHGCTEQTLNRFLPSVVVLQTMDKLGLELESTPVKMPDGREALLDAAEILKMAQAGIDRLQEDRRYDGWSWMLGGGSVDPLVNAWVLRGLHIAA